MAYNEQEQTLLSGAQTLQEVLDTGSILTANDTIDTDDKTLTISTANPGTNPLAVIADTGTALSVSSNSNGQALFVENDGIGPAISAVSTDSSGIGIISDSIGVAALLRRNAASTNDVVTVLDIQRLSSGSPANGMGGSIDLSVSTSGGPQISNRIKSLFTDITDVSPTSDLVITGVDSATEQDLVTLKGSGQIQVNQYGAGTFNADPVYSLGVTAAGLIVEKELSKYYEGQWTQTATDAPHIDAEGQNDFGVFVLDRPGTAGVYTITLAGAFPDADKFFPITLLIESSSKSLTYSIRRSSANNLTIEFYEPTDRSPVDLQGRIYIAFKQNP